MVAEDRAYCWRLRLVRSWHSRQARLVCISELPSISPCREAIIVCLPRNVRKTRSRMKRYLRLPHHSHRSILCRKSFVNIKKLCDGTDVGEGAIHAKSTACDVRRSRLLKLRERSNYFLGESTAVLEGNDGVRCILIPTSQWRRYRHAGA